MKKLCSLLLLFAALAGGGCATITSSEMQQVSLTTSTDAGQAVEQVKCVLRNDKGMWEATTPMFVSIHKSAADLSVECKKDGQPDGMLRAVSRVSGGMMGNIIFGGGVGALIDHTKGTGYNYPDLMPVVMGKLTTVDRNNQFNAGGQQPGSPPAQATPETEFDRQRGAVSK